MASRDSQGLQAGLIVSIIVNVALIVVAFFFWRSGIEKTNEVNRLTQVGEDLKGAAHKSLLAQQALEAMLTKTPSEVTNIAVENEGVKKLKEQYLADMNTYGGGAEEANRNYPALLAHLINELVKKNQQNTELTNTLKERTAQVQQNDQRKQEDLRIKSEEVAKVTQDLAGEREKFNAHIARVNQEKEEFEGELQKKNTDLLAANTTREQEKAKAAAMINNLQKQAKSQQSKLRELQGEATFQAPNGRVTHVDQKLGLVWINIGSGDGLPKQMRFSVYNKDQNGIDTENVKGKIEVIRLVDEHMAECKITDDSIRDPILPGDVIYSPVWRAGRKMGFALAGSMDVDKDGLDDRDLVKSLILAANAELHAELSADGQVQGRITAATRYLVRGAEPSERIQTGYTQMINQANAEGVVVLTLDEFLNLVGWQGDARRTQLHSSTDPKKFRERSPKRKSAY